MSWFHLHIARNTTRIIPFLVGNPYKPSFVTVTGWGVDLTYTNVTCSFYIKDCTSNTASMMLSYDLKFSVWHWTIAQLHLFFHVPWSPFEFLLILFPQPGKEFLNIRIPGLLHIKMKIIGRVVKLMTSLQKTKTCNNKSFNFWAFPISSTSLPC